MRSSNHVVFSIFVIGIIALCFSVYFNLYQNDFVNFDDPQYILENNHVKQGLTIDSVKWALSFQHEDGGYWHPLAWISLMLDYQLVGPNPQWYHYHNLFLHCLSSILLFLFFYRYTGNFLPSWLLGVFLVIHPMNVETVAWAVERKTVLGGFLWVCSLWMYGVYVKKRNIYSYFFSLILFVAALGAKFVTAPLIIVLALLDFWPLKRHQKSDEGGSGTTFHFSILSLADKIPFLLFAISAVVLSIHSIDVRLAPVDRNIVPLFLKLQNALYGYTAYAIKICMPINLCVYYPESFNIPVTMLVSSLFVLILTTLFSIHHVKKYPWFFVGWIWFLIALSPALGLFRRHLWPGMADRFVYFAMPGLFICIIWGINELTNKVSPFARKMIALASCFAIVIFVVMGNKQVSCWQNSGTLFDHALKVTSSNDIAYANSGWYRFEMGNMDGALDYFRKARAIDPLKVDELYALGSLALKDRNYEKAILFFKSAVQVNRNHLAAWYFLGIAYEKKGDFLAAASIFARMQDCITLDPKNYRSKGKYRLTEIAHPQIRDELFATDTKESLSSHADRLYRYGFLSESEMLLKQNGYPVSSTSTDEFILAQILKRKGDYTGAENAYINSMVSGNVSCHSLITAVEFLLDVGKTSKAEEIMQKFSGKRDCADLNKQHGIASFRQARWGDSSRYFLYYSSVHGEALDDEAKWYLSRLREYDQPRLLEMDSLRLNN